MDKSISHKPKFPSYTVHKKMKLTIIEIKTYICTTFFDNT